MFAKPLSLSASRWGAIALVGAASAVGYMLWALKHPSATRVTVFLTLNPIAAAGLGPFFLGESVGFAFAVGVVSVGICLAYREPNRAHSTNP